MVRSMLKNSRFRGSIEKKPGKCAQTLSKFEAKPFNPLYWSMGRQLSYKKSLIVIYKISKLFPNTLSTDRKYSLLDRDNLTQRIQMLLSRKQKTFSPFFPSFLKSSLNLEHFQKKDEPDSCCISEITDSQKHS